MAVWSSLLAALGGFLTRHAPALWRTAKNAATVAALAYMDRLRTQVAISHRMVEDLHALQTLDRTLADRPVAGAADRLRCSGYTITDDDAGRPSGG